VVTEKSTGGLAETGSTLSLVVVYSEHCKSSCYMGMMDTERFSEKWVTCNLREILSSYMVNQLCILWKSSRNPAVWLVKIFILFVFLLDSWKGTFKAWIRI